MTQCILGWPPENTAAVALDLYYKKKKKRSELWGPKSCCPLAIWKSAVTNADQGDLSRRVNFMFRIYLFYICFCEVRGGSHCGWFIVCCTRSGGGGYCTSWVGVCWGCVLLFGS